MDQLDAHLKEGGTIASFTPVSTADVVAVETAQHTPQHTEVNTLVNTEVNIPEVLETLTEKLDALAFGAAKQIATKMPPPDPIWYMGILDRAEREGWLLTTKEVQELIGVKPKTRKGENVYKQGCWLFIKAGKIGAQTAWRVEKRLPQS